MGSTKPLRGKKNTVICACPFPQKKWISGCERDGLPPLVVSYLTCQDMDLRQWKSHTAVHRLFVQLTTSSSAVAFVPAKQGPRWMCLQTLVFILLIDMRLWLLTTYQQSIAVIRISDHLTSTTAHDRISKTIRPHVTLSLVSISLLILPYFYPSLAMPFGIPGTVSMVTSYCTTIYLLECNPDEIEAG